MIQISELRKSLYGGGHRVAILNGIDLTIPSGQFVAIIGASGSGKTTLLSLMAGLDTPSSGNIVVDEKDITKLHEDELAALRARRFGFIFQNFQLLPTLTALENVIVPLELQGEKNASKVGMELLQKVGLSDRFHHYPSQLSGGEQQRVALARAFSNKPSILFADEPTGNLDPENKKKIMDILFNSVDEYKSTLITVTHDHEMLKGFEQTINFADFQKN